MGCSQSTDSDGRGGFGRVGLGDQVWKAVYKQNGNEYAVKKMSKLRILNKNGVNSVMNERKILADLSYIFIVNLEAAFQDKENLYLVMKLFRAADLRYHLCQYKLTFSEEEIIANIIVSLQYIHSRNVIHRDIKPENIVFDNQGFVYITDFGISRILRVGNNTDTSGTPGYMSPEVMFRMDHSFVSDYYAVGIIMYEFVVGQRPYKGKDRQEIREALRESQIKLQPEDAPNGVSGFYVDLVNRLIIRDPQDRLGAGGADEVKNHPFFDGFDWVGMEKMRAIPPYKPKVPKNLYELINYPSKPEEQNVKFEEKDLRSKEIQDYDMPFHFDRRVGEDTKERKTAGISLGGKGKVTSVSKTQQAQASNFKLKKYNLREQEPSMQEARSPVSSIAGNPQFSQPFLFKRSEIEVNDAEFDSPGRLQVPLQLDSEQRSKDTPSLKKKSSNLLSTDKPNAPKKVRPKKKG